MKPKDKRDFLTQIIEKTKNDRILDYTQSYSHITKNMYKNFNKLFIENNLTNNKRLLDLLEIRNQKIHNLHQEILTSIEDYSNKEKSKIKLMEIEELTHICAKDFTDLFAKNFDINLYELSSHLHARFEIEILLEIIQLEEQIMKI